MLIIIIIIIIKSTFEVNSVNIMHLMRTTSGKEHEAKSELKELVNQLKVSASVNFDSNLSYVLPYH